jgi:hypothetical protein
LCTVWTEQVINRRAPATLTQPAGRFMRRRTSPLIGEGSMSTNHACSKIVGSEGVDLLAFAFFVARRISCKRQRRVSKLHNNLFLLEFGAEFWFPVDGIQANAETFS